MTEPDPQTGHNRPKPEKIHIFIDQKKFEVDQPSLSGAQLRSLGGVPENYALFLEQSGEDREIKPTDSVALKNGMHFYSVPPATYGR